MIEIAPEEYHYRCDYDNIAFSLGVLMVDGKFGWRLPTKAEICMVTTTAYRGKCNWEFWLDLTEKTDFYYVSQPLNYFRQHATTIRSSIKMKTQIVEIYKMFYNHISKNQLDPIQELKLKLGAGAVWFSYFIENKKAWLQCFTTVYSAIN